jgi:hypothetical protein
LRKGASHTDRNGGKIHRYDQTYNDARVWGAYVVSHSVDENVLEILDKKTGHKTGENINVKAVDKVRNETEIIPFSSDRRNIHKQSERRFAQCGRFKNAKRQ